MLAFRRLALAHRRLAALICVAALALKLLVPSGYMISGAQGRIAITICSGVVAGSVSGDMPGMHGDMADHGTSKKHGKAETPCAFSGLSAQALGAIDPVLFVAALAFIMGVASRAARSHARPATPYLRPPLRGPPAFF